MEKLHLISNAHIDPVWQWKWEEGAGVAITTFGAASDFALHHEDYIFCHNESLLYEWVEKYNPELFTRIQELVKSGKWHIMGGWFLQPDCNMPEGESLVRQIKRGLHYFDAKFPGYKRPTTAINLDSFGHTKGLVQILNDAGYDSYIITRPSTYEKEECEVWRGFNNSKILIARVGEGYNTLMGQVDKKLLPYLDNKKDVKTGLFLWGIGNHGGGPSRLDYDIIQKIRLSHKDIDIVHSTPEAYFEDMKKKESTLKECGDLTHVNCGCYSSMVRIKQSHNQLEHALYEAEKMASIASLNGFKYPKNQLDEIEESLLFSEFHDILPGTVIRSSEDDALKLLGKGIHDAEEIKLDAFFYLARGEEKAKDGEYPFFVYNPHPYPISVTIEAEFMLKDQNWSETEHNEIIVKVGDDIIPSQIEKEESNVPLDWRKKVVFNATLSPNKIERFSCYSVLKNVEPQKQETGSIFDNGEMRVQFDLKTGLICSIKIQGKEYLKGSLGFNVIKNNENPWGFTYDNFNECLCSFSLMDKTEREKYSDVSKDFPDILLVESGSIRKVVETFLSCEDSKMVVRYTIPNRGTDLSIDIHLLNEEKNIKLRLSLPTTIENSSYFGSTAFGMNELDGDGRENVAQNYLVYKDSDKALSLINFGNYGSSLKDGILNQTLLNSAAYCAHPIDERKTLKPDQFNPRIDEGERDFSFVLSLGNPKEIEENIALKNLSLQEKPYTLAYFPTGDGQKMNKDFVLTNKNIMTSAFKKADDGNGYIIRLFNALNRKENTELQIQGKSFNLWFNGFEFKSFRLIENGIIPVNCLEETLDKED